MRDAARRDHLRSCCDGCRCVSFRVPAAPLVLAALVSALLALAAVGGIAVWLKGEIGLLMHSLIQAGKVCVRVCV